MRKLKIKIPWFTIVRLLGKELPDLIDELQAARSADSDGGTKITKDEFRDIFYDHMIMHLMPALFDAFTAANGWNK
tara:strand:+ start:2172 stop:2399 length:228 start_codon:yes stop_codon:yes gene_type:complete